MSINFQSTISQRLLKSRSPKPVGHRVKNETELSTSARDGLSDDMRNVLEHIRVPEAEHSTTVTADGKVTIRKGSPDEALHARRESSELLERKSKRKAPRTGSEMSSMLENIEKPPGVTALSVGDKGLITMEAVDSGNGVDCDLGGKEAYFHLFSGMPFFGAIAGAILDGSSPFVMVSEIQPLLGRVAGSSASVALE